MRRFTFYILIALLTFGIGSFIAFNFYSKVEDKPVSIDKKEEFVQSSVSKKPWDRPWKNTSKPTQEKEVPKKPFCKAKKILPVWNKLIKDKSFQDWGGSDNESFDCVDMLEIKEFDLNQDGRKEILLRGANFNLCSAVGNCAFWIYERKGKGFRKILYSTDYIDITEMPKQIQKNKTNDYFNVVLKGHLNASETSYETFKFDGRNYKESKCLVDACIICSSDNPKWEFISCREYDKRQNY